MTISVINALNSKASDCNTTIRTVEISLTQFYGTKRMAQFMQTMRLHTFIIEIALHRSTFNYSNKKLSAHHHSLVNICRNFSSASMPHFIANSNWWMHTFEWFTTTILLYAWYLLYALWYNTSPDLAPSVFTQMIRKY